MEVELLAEAVADELLAAAVDRAEVELVAVDRAEVELLAVEVPDVPVPVLAPELLAIEEPEVPVPVPVPRLLALPRVVPAELVFEAEESPLAEPAAVLWLLLPDAPALEA